MPKYFFTAKSQKGESYSGAREAEDEKDLARALRQEGYILISAEAKNGGERSFKRDLSLIIPFFGTISLKDKMMLARNLRVMIGAGIALPRAIKILAGESRSQKFRRILLEVAEKIIKGQSFSDALAGYPDVFSDLFRDMVRVGEESGTLEENLDALSRNMEREHNLKTKIRGAMMYPAVIILAMIGIGILMLVVVVPQLAKTFKELGVELPLATRLVINLGTVLAEKWYLIILGAILFFLFARSLLKTKKGKEVIGMISLKTPIIAPILKKSNAAHTIRNLAFLTNAGVPLVRSLEIISGSLTNVYFKQAIGAALEEVKKGEKLSDALDRYQNLYPAMVIQMLRVGEETGETSNILKKLAVFFEEEVTNEVQNLTAIIEPILMLAIGGVVGFFAISMIQPMYSMLQGLQ